MLEVTIRVDGIADTEAKWLREPGGSFNTAINLGSGTATTTSQGAQVRQFSERQLQFAFRLTF
jgi:hypothetical protein